MSHDASTHKHPTTPWIDLYAGPFLDEESWVGADDMRVQRGGSKLRCRVAWVRAWPVNVGVARVGTPLRGEASMVVINWRRIIKKGTHDRFVYPPIAEGSG